MEYDNITIKPLPNVYPVGDEVVLIKETTGITLQRGVLPISHKLMVMNVETLLNVYKKIFADQNVIHSCVTIIGEVENQGTYQLPIGMSLEEILNTLTKPLMTHYKVIVGGPMTGKLASVNEVVRKNTKAFIVLPYDHRLVKNMEEVNTTHLKRIMASCSQCRACTDMCPRHLLGHQVEPHKLMNAMANGLKDNVNMLKTALGCVDCGVCELYACHHDLSPRKMMVAVKKAYAEQGVRPSPEGCIEPHKDREYRRVPSKRLVMHLNLSKYDVHLPFIPEVMKAKKVRIPLSHHIGAPAICLAKVGTYIMENQIIASGQEGKLSANIHASISGNITKANSEFIEIERV
jgi:Na+-translocating ferredoxin:NAD+ oxidoreductase RnfC subunit